MASKKNNGIPEDSLNTVSKLYMDLQIKQTEMQTDIKYIKDCIIEIKANILDFHKGVKDDMGEFKKEINESKANKWVETISYLTIGALVTGVFYAIFNIITGK